MWLFEEMETVVTHRSGRLLDHGRTLVSYQEQIHTECRRRLRLDKLASGPPTSLGDSPFLTADRDDTPSTMGTFPRRGDP